MLIHRIKFSTKLQNKNEPLLGPFLLKIYFTLTSSTSKISQALGGITPPAPLAP